MWGNFVEIDIANASDAQSLIEQYDKSSENVGWQLNGFIGIKLPSHPQKAYDPYVLYGNFA
jgi:hypothetical protein